MLKDLKHWPWSEYVLAKFFEVGRFNFFVAFFSSFCLVLTISEVFHGPPLVLSPRFIASASELFDIAAPPISWLSFEVLVFFELRGIRRLWELVVLVFLVDLHILSYHTPAALSFVLYIIEQGPLFTKVFLKYQVDKRLWVNHALADLCFCFPVLGPTPTIYQQSFQKQAAKDLMVSNSYKCIF